jgi:hypothetical protein
MKYKVTIAADLIGPVGTATLEGFVKDFAHACNLSGQEIPKDADPAVIELTPEGNYHLERTWEETL